MELWVGRSPLSSSKIQCSIFNSEVLQLLLVHVISDLFFLPVKYFLWSPFFFVFVF